MVGRCKGRGRSGAGASLSKGQNNVSLQQVRLTLWVPPEKRTIGPSSLSIFVLHICFFFVFYYWFFKMYFVSHCHRCYSRLKSRHAAIHMLNVWMQAWLNWLIWPPSVTLPSMLFYCGSFPICITLPGKLFHPCTITWKAIWGHQKTRRWAESKYRWVRQKKRQSIKTVHFFGGRAFYIFFLSLGATEATGGHSVF